MQSKNVLFFEWGPIGQWKVKTTRLGAGSMHGAGCWHNLTNGVDDGGLWPSKPRRHGGGASVCCQQTRATDSPKNDAALCGPCFCGANRSHGPPFVSSLTLVTRAHHERQSIQTAMSAAANGAHPPQHAATAPAANPPSSTASSTEAGRSNNNSSSIGGGDGVSGSGGEVEVSNAENGAHDRAVDGSDDNEPRVIEVKIQLPGKATEPIVLPVRWHAAMSTRTRSLTHVLATISAVGAACCHVHTFRKECAAVFPKLVGSWS